MSGLAMRHIRVKTHAWYLCLRAGLTRREAPRLAHTVYRLDPTEHLAFLKDSEPVQKSLTIYWRTSRKEKIRTLLRGLSAPKFKWTLSRRAVKQWKRWLRRTRRRTGTRRQWLSLKRSADFDKISNVFLLFLLFYFLLLVVLYFLLQIRQLLNHIQRQLLSVEWIFLYVNQVLFYNHLFLTDCHEVHHCLWRGQKYRIFHNCVHNCISELVWSVFKIILQSYTDLLPLQQWALSSALLTLLLIL